MTTHRITAGHRARIMLEADSVSSAVIGNADIAHKYDVKCQCFVLDFDDTTELNPGELLITYEKDGEQRTATHILETV